MPCAVGKAIGGGSSTKIISGHEKIRFEGFMFFLHKEILKTFDPAFCREGVSCFIPMKNGMLEFSV